MNSPIILPNGFNGKFHFAMRYDVEVWKRQKSGRLLLKELDSVWNLTPNAGLDYSLNVLFKGTAGTSSWYVGLIDNDAFSALAAVDTMAVHTGWTELTTYSEAARQAWTTAAVASQSLTNSASKAIFSINAAASDIYGAFLVNDSTKGGSSGTMFSEAAFSTVKNLGSGDELRVTATMTASSV